jgi:hypothetical protein
MFSIKVHRSISYYTTQQLITAANNKAITRYRGKARAMEKFREFLILYASR